MVRKSSHGKKIFEGEKIMKKTDADKNYKVGKMI